MNQGSRSISEEEGKIIEPYLEEYSLSEPYSQKRRDIIKELSNQLGGQISETKIRQWIQKRNAKAKRDEKIANPSTTPPKYAPNIYSITQPYQNPNFQETSSVLGDPMYQQISFHDDNFIWICYKREKRVKKLWTMYLKCSKCNSKMNISKSRDGRITYEYKEDLHTESCAVNQHLHEISDNHLLDMRSQAIQSYLDSKGTKSEVTIAAEVAHAAHMKRVQDPTKLVPRATAHQVKNWVSNLKPVNEKKMMSLPIPISAQMPDGKNLYCRQSKTFPATMHIFFTDDAISMAKETPRLLLDGTFETSPPEFKQVFSGQGFDRKSQSYYPLFHALLQGSDKRFYRACLVEIVELLSFNSLNKILVDFEHASIKAIKKVLIPNYPNVVVQGCYFHYSQAIRRKIDSLAPEVKSQLQVFFNALLLAPFISFKNVDILNSYMESITLLHTSEFMDYWTRTWGFKGLFKPKLWNAFGKIDKEFVTTDGIERFHREMKKSLGSHPNLMKFIKDLYQIDVTFQHQVQNNETDRVPEERPSQNTCLKRIQEILGEDINFILDTEKPVDGIILKPSTLKTYKKKPRSGKDTNISTDKNTQKKKYQKKSKASTELENTQCVPSRKSGCLLDVQEFPNQFPIFPHFDPNYAPPYASLYPSPYAPPYPPPYAPPYQYPCLIPPQSSYEADVLPPHHTFNAEVL